MGRAVWHESDGGLFFLPESFYHKRKAIEEVREGSWRQEKPLRTRLFFQD
jgi:hypothetical protein